MMSSFPIHNLLFCIIIECFYLSSCCYACGHEMKYHLLNLVYILLYILEVTCCCTLLYYFCTLTQIS